MFMDGNKRSSSHPDEVSAAFTLRSSVIIACVRCELGTMCSDPATRWAHRGRGRLHRRGSRPGSAALFTGKTADYRGICSVEAKHTVRESNQPVIFNRILPRAEIVTVVLLLWCLLLVATVATLAGMRFTARSASSWWKTRVCGAACKAGSFSLSVWAFSLRPTSSWRSVRCGTSSLFILTQIVVQVIKTWRKKHCSDSEVF